MNISALQTRPLWLHLLVSKSIKRIDDDYAYLEGDEGYLVLKSNKGFFRWLLPWLKLCTVKLDYELCLYSPYIIPNFDELLLFIEQLIKDDIHQEFIKDNTDDPWRALYESKGYNQLLTPISDDDKINAAAVAHTIDKLSSLRIENAKNQLRRFNRS